MRQVKFSVFADLHHHDPFPTFAKERLQKIRERAEQNKVDFVIHCGDLCHGPVHGNNPEIVKQYAEFPMPTYHCMGNHEYQFDSHEDALAGYGLKSGYYFFDCNGFRFIVLDLNNMLVDGKTVPYSSANSFRTPEKQALVTMGEDQFAWLEQTIMDSPYPCVLFSHQSLERVHSGMLFAEQQKIWAMFRRANSDRQRILMAVNGHHHRDNLRILDGIAYLDLNSASSEWIGDPGHQGYLPAEIYQQYPQAHRNIYFTEPVHAVITLREDGYVKIEGMQSEFWCGADRESLGLPLADADGRLCTPNVLSAEFTLSMKGLIPA